MDRRTFIRITGAAAAGLVLTGTPAGASGCRGKRIPGGRMKGHFTMTQISSVADTIGNSYLFRTSGGKVVMVDGGFPFEAENLREHIAAVGNRVDLWFITHPHNDHHGALDEILKDWRGIWIDTVVYSRLPDGFLSLEQGYDFYAREYYRTIDNNPGKTDFHDLHVPGARYDIDGVGIMVLGVSNPEIRTNPFNNSSMILRFWDDSKSVLILGDAGVECGDKVLASWRDYLDCDYLQVAHHGQNGCSEQFYKSISFRACLWPTPTAVWDPAPGSLLKTLDTRRWMAEKGIAEHHVSCLEKDWVLR